jgi:hypothetical protein
MGEWVVWRRCVRCSGCVVFLWLAMSTCAFPGRHGPQAPYHTGLSARASECQCVSTLSSVLRFLGECCLKDTSIRRRYVEGPKGSTCPANVVPVEESTEPKQVYGGC